MSSNFLSAGSFDPIATFHEAWELVWEMKLQFNARSGSCENSRYRNHLLNTIGHLKLNDITLLLDGLKTRFLKTGLKPQTVRHILDLVKCVFNCLIQFNLYHGVNPASRIAIPWKDNTRQRYLTKKEANLLLASLKRENEQLWQISLLSLSTGMRAGEIFHLRGEHVNLGENWIRIVDPKNGKNRSAYIPETALDMLKDCFLAHGKLVFPSPKGTFYRVIPKLFRKTVKDLGFNAGLTDPPRPGRFSHLAPYFCFLACAEGSASFCRFRTPGSFIDHDDKAVCPSKPGEKVGCDHNPQFFYLRPQPTFWEPPRLYSRLSRIL